MICITRIPQVSVRPPPRRSESCDETEVRRRRTPTAINQRHAIRAVGACELAEALENLAPLHRSLDEAGRQAFREKLRSYLCGSLAQSEWLQIVRAMRG
jgi:hypothetical protein